MNFSYSFQWSLAHPHPPSVYLPSPSHWARKSCSCGGFWAGYSSPMLSAISWVILKCLASRRPPSLLPLRPFSSISSWMVAFICATFASKFHFPTPHLSVQSVPFLTALCQLSAVFLPISFCLWSPHLRRGRERGGIRREEEGEEERGTPCIHNWRRPGFLHNAWNVIDAHCLARMVQHPWVTCWVWCIFLWSKDSSV